MTASLFCLGRNAKTYARFLKIDFRKSALWYVESEKKKLVVADADKTDAAGSELCGAAGPGFRAATKKNRVLSAFVR